MMFPSRSLSRRHAGSSRTARTRRRLPSLEALEGRQLMSLGSEFLTPVNTTTRNAQFDSDNASSANGSSVAVWTDTFNAFDHDIRAQRFNAAGGKVGPEILVAGSSHRRPHARRGHGQPWRLRGDLGLTLPSGDTNVVAQRFNASGVPLGGVVQVGVGTFKEHDPDVAMDAQGDFVVSYTRDTNNNNPDVFAKRYNASGQLLDVVNVATSAKAETPSSVAMTPDGRFDVAWEDALSTDNHDIKLNRYSTSGGLLGANTIASSTAFDSLPSVAMDNSGNAVVAWQQGFLSDIKARRVSSNGIMCAEINIANNGQAVERHASVALAQSGGRFVVAYDSAVIFTSTRTMVAEVAATNVVTTFDAGVRYNPAISIRGAGNYLVTYNSNDGPPDGVNVRGRRGHLA